MWELHRLNDERWSVRKDGVEWYILPTSTSRVVFSEQAAQQLARMLNVIDTALTNGALAVTNNSDLIAAREEYEECA